MLLTESGGDLLNFLSNLSPSEALLLVVFLALNGGNLGLVLRNFVKTNSVYSQTIPNHGSSMRDAIDRISETVEKNSQSLEELKNNFEHERKHSEQYREMLEGRISVLENVKSCKRKK